MDRGRQETVVRVKRAPARGVKRMYACETDLDYTAEHTPLV